MLNFMRSTQCKNSVHGQVASAQSSEKAFVVTNFFFNLSWLEQILYFIKRKRTGVNWVMLIVRQHMTLIILKYKCEKQQTEPMSYKLWDLTKWIKIHYLIKNMLQTNYKSFKIAHTDIFCTWKRLQKSYFCNLYEHPKSPHFILCLIVIISACIILHWQ